MSSVRTPTVGSTEPAGHEASVLAAMTEHAVVGTAGDGRILSWNTGARHLYGPSAEQVIGVRTLAELFTPPAGGADPADRRWPPVDRWEGEVDVATPAGATIRSWVVVTPRRSADAPDGVVLVGRLSPELPQAGPLPGARLVSKLGHELRGPLGGILGLTHLLLTTLAAGPVDSGRLTQRIQLLHTSGERLLRTVDRLVDVAGVEAAPPRPPVPFDCRAVVEGLTGPEGPAGAPRPRTLAVVPDHPVLVLGDEDALRRLLRELIDNATAVGAQVRVRVHPAEGGSVRIEVGDDGPGLPPPELARVLRPYERGGGSGDGTGLGLHVARVLADRLDAGLSVRSEAGTGTTFTLRLPAG